MDPLRNITISLSKPSGDGILDREEVIKSDSIRNPFIFKLYNEFILPKLIPILYIQLTRLVDLLSLEY
ncbi:hypothetical protein [Alkaliphilus peptidifermentans]|uniref:hypothetical protein n=1 Tax=Alkaliphilus peptidifermentans TaxID=426129 RepID=UPI000B874B1D|nr:hypothetical protein [Alkaliphilus peptidifermentans]